MNVKSPLTYPGSKIWAIDKILPLVPRFEEYREPFVGGLNVFLAIKQDRGNNKRYWINDLYTTLYNFYLQIQQNPDVVIDQVLKWKNEFQYKGRQLQQFLKINAHTFNGIQKAAAYFTWNLTSFSGFGRGFSESNFNKKFNDDRIRRLTKISELLQGISITNLDYQKIVEAPPDGIDEDNIFLFADPPYYNVISAELYGKKGDLHRYFDHQRFANVMRKCKYPFLITYDNSNTIKRLFDWANIVEWELTYTSRRVKTGKELFISNMDINNIKDKQKTIDDAWS